MALDESNNSNGFFMPVAPAYGGGGGFGILHNVLRLAGSQSVVTAALCQLALDSAHSVCYRSLRRKAPLQIIHLVVVQLCADPGNAVLNAGDVVVQHLVLKTGCHLVAVVHPRIKVSVHSSAETVAPSSHHHKQEEQNDDGQISAEHVAHPTACISGRLHQHGGSHAVLFSKCHCF